MEQTKTYKGIIFNSTTVKNLSGDFLQKVRENNIKTAVVTRKTRSEIKKDLRSRGISVDVIIGCNDLNTRHTKYVKPMADPMVIATAMMHLEVSDVACWGDYWGDKQACEASGVDYCYKGKGVIEKLGSLPSEEILQESPTVIEPPVTGIMGAICGDIIGSAYEFHPTSDFNFEAFAKGTHVTDDSVATLAVASWLMGDRSEASLVKNFVGICNRYPNAGYGPAFKRWLRSLEQKPYGGNTNGAMMRASACGWVASTLSEAMELGKMSASVSHNSDEGIAGAQAVSSAIWMLRNGMSKQHVKDYIENVFDINLEKTVEQHRAERNKDQSCHITGAQAFRCWYESSSFEEAIRNAVTLQTDADTVADIAGALAAATPGMEIPAEWSEKCYDMLPEDLRNILGKFYQGNR